MSSRRRDPVSLGTALDLEDRARELADMDRDEDAADMYRVAADVREELGDAYYALTDRVAARRLLVTAWAKDRWPGQITWFSVFTVLPSGGRHGDRESWTFRIISTHPDDSARVDVTVRIDRRDRIRILRGGAE